jgi:hypothetical protein
MRRWWWVGREWLLPAARFPGEDTIDTEDGIPLSVESSEHDLFTEGT